MTSQILMTKFRLTILILSLFCFEMSQAATLLKKISPWESNFSLEHFQPIRDDKYGRSLFAAELDYKSNLNPFHSLQYSLSTQISRSWNPNLETPNKLDFLQAGADLKKSFVELDLNYGLSLGLPVSEDDEKTSFQGSISIPTFISTDLSVFHTAAGFNSHFYSYKYETANQSGTTYNPKYSFSGFVSVGTSFNARISWQNQIASTQVIDMNQNQKQFYSGYSKIQWQINRQMQTSLGFSSRDQVETNKDFLSTDVSSYMFNFGMRF